MVIDITSTKVWETRKDKKSLKLEDGLWKALSRARHALSLMMSSHQLWFLQNPRKTEPLNIPIVKMYFKNESFGLQYPKQTGVLHVT